jgi:hypothetical protein
MGSITEKMMPKMTINVENYDPKTTVRMMRKELARVLSRLTGDRKATFNLTVRLGDHDGKS